MSQPRIHPSLLGLLVSGKFTEFTCPALTQAFFELPGCTSPTRRAASQLVARTVKQLTAAGLVEVTSTASVKSKRYVLNERFAQVYADAAPAQNGTAPPDHRFVDDLRDKLHAYKIELLEAVGEVEEYERICQAAPDRMPQIQALYSQARDRFSKTQGHVKAIETILSQLGDQ